MDIVTQDGFDYAKADWCPWCDKPVARNPKNACPVCGRYILKKIFKKPFGMIAIWDEKEEGGEE